MTTIAEVTETLFQIEIEHDNDLAKQWQHNEIIKKKLAQSYDAWITDMWDHKTFLTLEEHIITFIDRHQYFGDEIFQG